ncbi:MULTISPECIES: carboxylesterase/lipase family protein [Brevibacterium]|uniref:Carboxylic ester hydrolase n=1 Tax=Brevibacterium salitolerans TaxID=1403566 RepID=A0ABP5HYY3_9MICO|nr:carboxylesterase family protein [Brevibacterium sp.]
MTQVHTRSGIVEGTREAGVHAFLGVPYAQAPAHTGSPTGEFDPPQPAAPWDGVRPARSHGPTVPQYPYPPVHAELLANPLIPGEEYLNVNVWTPDPTASLPVYVFIHGGAFVHGSGAVPQYDGTAFARDGIVCVTLNYRLGAHGWLQLPDGPANIGLRDQIAALTWVRENIAAFGGDPERVTIGGESAGAMSVGALLASPAASGLFRGAILQSGAGHHSLPPETAHQVTLALAEKLGIAPTRTAFAAVPQADLLTAVKALTVQVQTERDVARFREVAANSMLFSPTVDGEVLPTAPITAMTTGTSADVPVLIGTNTDENTLFTVPSGAYEAADTAALHGTLRGLGFADPEEAAALFDDTADPRPGAALTAVLTDWMFRIPAVRAAEARAATATSPSFMYEFAWPSGTQGGRLRACHALELPFAFDTLDAEHSAALTGPEAPQALADEVHAAWVSFIRDGDPGWEPYSPDHRAVEVFDLERRTFTDPHSERTAAWEGLR